MKKWLLIFAGIVALAIILGLYWGASIHWFFIHTGTYNESGPYYGFFSGCPAPHAETIVEGAAAPVVRLRQLVTYNVRARSSRPGGSAARLGQSTRTPAMRTTSSHFAISVFK